MPDVGGFSLPLPPPLPTDAQGAAHKDTGVRGHVGGLITAGLARLAMPTR